MISTALAVLLLQNPVAGPASMPELTAAIRAQDARLFKAVFDDCDIPVLKTLIADDLEFFHDKNGLMTTSGPKWIEGVAGMCERQKTGEDYRAKREMVEGTDAVYPLNNYGAVHTGVHRFIAVAGEKKGQVLEISRFLNIWRKDQDGWRLSRVVSYDHRLD